MHLDVQHLDTVMINSEPRGDETLMSVIRSSTVTSRGCHLYSGGQASGNKAGLRPDFIELITAGPVGHWPAGPMG